MSTEKPSCRAAGTAPAEPPLPAPQRLAASHFQQNKLLRTLRSVEQGLRARLRSIDHDAEQVLNIYRRLFPNGRKSLPLYGNARAGSWYVPPVVDKIKTSTCSFKSADGHYGQWSSSLRRPNIHVLVDSLEHGGVVVVDVTRRGKKWPDSFTKTIPIWCAVINIVTGLANCQCEMQTAAASSRALCLRCIPLHLHPDVPDSEREQIVSRLLCWVEDWQRSSLSLNRILPKLSKARKSGKPLRPIWVKRDSRLWENGLPLEDLPFIPIICLSASKVVKAGYRSFVEPRMTLETVCGVKFAMSETGFPYVQGAGDDEEAWSHGLTPALMWEHRESLMRMADIAFLSYTAGKVEEDLKCKISTLIAENFVVSPLKESGPTARASEIWNTRLFLMTNTRRENLGNLVRQIRTTFHAVIVLGATCPVDLQEERSEQQEKKSLKQNVEAWFSLQNNKGKVDYKYGFGRALGPCLSLLRRSCVDEKKSALVCCTAKDGDWSAGLAIAWMAWHCELSSEISEKSEELHRPLHGYKLNEERKTKVGEIPKAKITSVMLHFMSAFPQFQLSRSTLKQLNRFFSSPQPSSALINE